ncbi:hypothetical protein [Sulfuriroseicoccus oceanibius]|uniref:Replication protein n=1 Tax=Sulfuriroseicoccus oceanibius TaxID=2707525 RepID=A0A6B3L198_9BACT|nr:hypothetical protein [Sulfuriroseicoccus oceanibius]QQL46077.1 hypothetical protein G3M56_005715 [Sulfuriroseicoccus oceanibius]
MKRAGVQIVFRSTELGTMKRQEDLPTFHLHVHAIVQMTRKLPKAEWSYLLQRVRGWWRHHFKDSQEVHQAREVCKYVVKPPEIEALSGEELKALYEQTFRLHLVQCLGALKDQRKTFEENDTMPRKESERWVVVKNWNAGRGKPSTSGKPSRNSIVCTLAPAAYLTNIKEPAAIILNYSDKSMIQQDKLARARDAALLGHY